MTLGYFGDSLKQFYLETQKKASDEFRISRLKNDIRENAKLLLELAVMLSTLITYSQGNSGIPLML